MREKKYCPLLDRLAGAAIRLDGDGWKARAKTHHRDNQIVADLLEALEATNKLLGVGFHGLGTLDTPVAVQIAENNAAISKAYGESE